MKRVNRLILLSATLIALSGCGGGGSSTEPTPTKPEARGIPTKDFDVVACSDPNDSGCLEARAFDLKKQNVAVLNPPKDIGVSEFIYFNGKRFGVVPKEENKLSPLNFIAYGLFKYAQDAGSDWCGPCRMVAPVSYEDAKKQLKELFNLTGTKEQNEALLWLINKNLERMGDSGIDVKEAYFADIKAIAESLVNLTKKGEAPDLSSLHLVKDSKGRVLGISSTPKNDCPDYLGGCIDSWGVLDKNRAIKLGYNIHQKSGTQPASQQAFESLTCKANENKQIFMYGVEDNFDMSNSEPVHPQGVLQTYYNSLPNPSSYDNNTSMPSVDANGNTVNYNPLMFADTISGLPTNITKGRIAIGFKRLEKATSSNSSMILTNAAVTDGSLITMPNPATGGWSHISNTQTYFQDLDQLSFINSNINMLQYLQSGNNNFNAYAVGYIDIDYIAVAVCTPQEPSGIPIPDVPVKLECNANKGENFTEVFGGIGDNFDIPLDATNPPPGLTSTIKYDENITKAGTFADRILLPNQTITKMVVTVNTRAGANGYQNDKLILGDISNNNGILHDPNDSGVATTLNGGVAHQITNNNLLINIANSNHYLDVVAYNQTEVDSVRVSMCVVDKKDGDLNITKNPGRKFTKDGINYSYFNISVGGTLPYGETLTINEHVPNGATLESYYSTPSTQPSWVCTPNPTVYGPTTVTCSISATNGDITNIPTLNVLMGSKFEKLENCVEINKESQGTSYNNNPDNDRDCATSEFDPPKGGDLAITKKVIKSYTDKEGVNHAVYGISVSGVLPANKPLTIDEVVPSGAKVTSITHPTPWSCAPSNTPINGPATIQCSIPAQTANLYPIPDIIIEMESNKERLENCANINDKFSPTPYNTNPENDKSCDTALFKPVEECSQRLEIDLSNPSIWKDSSGNSATPMTNINYYWDHDYTWLDASANFATTKYKTDNFCACGEDGYVKVKGLKTDNKGRVILNNITQQTALSIAEQTTLTTHNFLANYPAATGSAVIHSTGTYNLEFDIYNEDNVGGGAVKGKLIFTGHWGNCKPKDSGLPSPMDPSSIDPNVISDINSTGVFDDNTTVAVVSYKKEFVLPSRNPKPITIVKGKDLHEITRTPEEVFGDKLPSNYSVVVGCSDGYINVIIKNTITKVYESSIECSGDWVKYYNF